MSDAELMALADAATPGGAAKLGGAEPPIAPVDAPMARQVPPGTPGAVEGPIETPQDNPTDLGSGGPAPYQLHVPPGPEPAPPPDPQFIAPLVTGRPTMAGASQAIDRATQAGLDEARAQNDVGPAKAAEREANAASADKVSEQARAQQAELDVMARAQAEGIQRARELADKAQQEFANTKLHEYWDETGGRTTSDRIKANIFIGLGAAGQGLVGGDNPALERLKMSIDNDFKLQKAKLDKAENFAKMKADGVTSLESTYKMQLAMLTLKQGAATKAVADEAKAQAIRSGAPVEQAENNVIVQGLRQKALELDAKGREGLWKSSAELAMTRARLAQSADKAPTQGEQENAARGRNMTLALGALEDSGMGNYVPPNGVVQKWLSNQDQIAAAAERGKSTLGQGVNFIARKADKIPANEFEGLSPKDKEYFTLVRQYLEPYARKQSGAAISSSEWQNFMNQIGPQSGKAGKALREQAARDSVTLGGRATKMLEQADATAGRATPTVKPAPAGRRVSFKGQPGTLLPGGLFQPDGP